VRCVTLLATHATLRVFDGGHLFMLQDRDAVPTIIDFLRG
jgi:surfactin synthase thioesterase subunit